MNTILRVVKLRSFVRAFLFIGLFVQLTVLSPVIAQDGTVRSKLSTNTITRDESVTLEITAIGMDAELDLSSLNKDFEVAGRSSSREIRSVMQTGSDLRTTSYVTWAVELLPRGVGIFTVPPVRVGNVSSQSHTLTVNELPTGAQRDIFVESVVDTKTPWVQSQVIMTLKVFQAIEIVDGGLDVPEAENLIVERLGEDVRANETRNGRQYSVTTRRFALFPQKSGELILEPITLSVSVPAGTSRVRGFFSPTRKLTRRTDSIVLDVKPRPNNDSAWWLPAKGVQLTSKWIGDVSAAMVDQPLTRTIVLRASGVTDSQLPEINIPAIEGASLYAEEPLRKLGANQQGVLSELTINWAVIPQRAGELVLPAVSVEWFNTLTGKVETAVLPEEKIVVSLAQSTAQSGSSTQNGASNLSQLATNDNVAGTQGDAGIESGSNAIQAGANTSIDSASLDTEYASFQAESSAAMEKRLQDLEASVVPWRNAALASVGLWLLSIVAFLWMRYRQKKLNDDSHSSAGRLGAVRNAASDTLARMKPLGGVSASCKAGSPSDVRQALLEWSARQWSEDPPLTLSSLSKRLARGDARDSIESLDKALYSPGQSAGDSELLSSQLSSLPGYLKAALDAGDVQVSSKRQPVSDNASHKLPVL